MAIVQGVEHHAPVTTRPDEPQAAQQPQLVRYRGLRQREHRREVAHAQFAMREHVEDADPSGIAERAERIGQRR